MRTLNGLARDVGAIIREGGLFGPDPIAIRTTADPGEAVTPGAGQSTASMAFDPARGKGEVRISPGGTFSDICTFFAEVPPGFEADDDTHTALLARLRDDLAGFAAAEFGAELAEVRS